MLIPPISSDGLSIAASEALWERVSRRFTARRSQIFWAARSAVAAYFGYRAIGVGAISVLDSVLPEEFHRCAMRMIELAGYVAAVGAIPSFDGSPDELEAKSGVEFLGWISSGGCTGPVAYGIDPSLVTEENLNLCLFILGKVWFEVVNA